MSASWEKPTREEKSGVPDRTSSVNVTPSVFSSATIGPHMPPLTVVPLASTGDFCTLILSDVQPLHFRISY